MSGLNRFSVTRRNFLISALSTAAVTKLPASLIAESESTISIQNALSKDPRRPQFHLLPARNWMNDPNAPLYWNGLYHMFYQYNPNGAYWGDMHWGHAVSPDMVHWKHLPLALAPSPGGPDEGGCFSGSALIEGKRVVVFYTGVVNSTIEQATLKDGVKTLRETQCMAYSDDDQLIQWHKLPQAVIPSPPAGMKATGFRDPSAWKDGEWWYLTVGSGIELVGGAVLLYRSRDLTHWEYLNLLERGSWSGKRAPNPVSTGEMWECPEFFPLDGKHVLIYSTQGKSYWQIGTFDVAARVFKPESDGILDYGSFYAPKTQLDAHGQRILWGWVRETRNESEYRAAGWAGMMSLPRVLHIGKSGRLQMEISDAMTVLRRSRSSSTAAPEGGSFKLKGACGELVLNSMQSASPFEIAVTLPDDGQEILHIAYQPDARTIALDRTMLPLEPTDQLTMHAYIDGSVIELIVNRQLSYTKRFYYPGPTSPNIAISLKGATEPDTHLSIWQLAPISNNRLTTSS